MKHLSQDSLHYLIKSKRPFFATMASAHLPLTAANVIKCNLVPPEVTGRDIADELMPFARALARRWVEQKPTRRKAIELPPSVELHLFIFVERTEANPNLQGGAQLSPLTKARPRRTRKITNSILNREVYMKKCEEETKRSMALDVTHFLQDCTRERELDLMNARLVAAAKEISDYIVESKIDEQMQLLDVRLRKAASDIDKHIEEEKNAAERETQMIELELRLLEAAGEIEHRLQVLERGLPLSAHKAEASGDEH